MIRSSFAKRAATVAFALMAAFVAPAILSAQEAPAPAAAPVSAPADVADGSDETGAAAYSYDPAGRRDPFRSLLVGSTSKPQADGPAGILIEELKLQGFWGVRSGMLAQMLGPNGKTWLLRKGDQLADGEVLNITANEIVFRQNVNDPTMLKPFREVVRELNPTTPR